MRVSQTSMLDTGDGEVVDGWDDATLFDGILYA